MFFLLRSAFWLTIVFSCMNWPGGERPVDVARQTAGEMAVKARSALIEKAAASCASAPVDCLSAMDRVGVAQKQPSAKRYAQAKSPD